MKSKEEIKLMGEKYAITHEDVSDRLGKYLVSACFQDGYIQCQCQEDMDKKYTEEDMLNASKYGYEFRDTTSFPEHKFEDSCINNTKQWIYSLNKQD